MALIAKTYLSTVLENERFKDQAVRHAWFLLSALSLACRWQPSHCVLMGCGLSSALLSPAFVCKCPRLIRTTRISFQCSHCFKDPVSKCNHILKYWESGLQHMDLGWGIGGYSSAHNTIFIHVPDDLLKLSQILFFWST